MDTYIDTHHLPCLVSLLKMKSEVEELNHQFEAIITRYITVFHGD